MSPIPFIFLILLLLLLVYVLYGTNQWRTLFHHIRLNYCFFITHAKRHQNKYSRNEELYPPGFTLAPGNILRFNNRNTVAPLYPKTPSYLKVVSWNIEMGYKLDEVIAELKHIAPDVLLLQEADLYDDSQNYSVHTVREIANTLGFSATFAGHHPYTTQSGRGIWGNAILSHFKTRKEYFLPLKCSGNYERSALFAEVQTSFGAVDFCSVHLEACCGIEKRVKQMTNVIAQSLKRQEGEPKPMVIGGDLNTICGGLIRLSPVHCADGLRFMTIGMTEAEWWEKNFFSNLPFSDPFCKREDRTFKNFFIAAKLDWILIKDLVLVGKEVGEGTQSDHKWISCTVRKK
jgi:endonuclease/exonuclease/phosphatase family metal-dependent hydrolase